METKLPSKPMGLRDVTGSRGEWIALVRLTEYLRLSEPLFRPAFLGDKYPVIDFFVSLNGVSGMRPYFLAQSKTSTAELRRRATNLKISTTRHDIAQLLKVPGPTYIIGVHEPTERAFVKSVHAGMAVKAITRIELEHELTRQNLQRLHDEVARYWESSHLKPTNSVFA